MPHLKTIFAATRDALALLGLAALAGFYAQERSLLWLAPATLLVCGVWYCVFKIREYFGRRKSSATARERVPGAGAAHVAGKASVGKEFRHPPKSVRYVYTLTEGKIPVQVEYDRRAVDNWLALGDDHDAIAHELGRQLT